MTTDTDLAQRLDDRLAVVLAGFTRFIMIWSAVVNGVWWLTDSLTMGALPGAVHNMGRVRLCVMGAAGLVLLIVRGQRVLGGARFVACAIVWLAEFAGCAACIARIGDLSTPWFNYLYPLIIASIVLPLRLWVRVVLSTLMGAALLVGYLIVRPEAVHSPFFTATVNYLVFTVGVAIAFGHQAYLLTRKNHEQQLVIEQSAETIAGQREVLRQEVELRTAELRALAEHLDRTSEEERRRIARDLHDELGQNVSALRLSLATALRRFAREPTSIRANLEDLDELVQRVADGTRDAITHLRPRILDDLGLGAAAEWLVERTEKLSGLRCELQVSSQAAHVLAGAQSGPRGDEPRTADATSTAAFRILQEALTNVVRHARATRVEVRIDASQERLDLIVEDDGIGLPPEGGRRSGMGLISMRERARTLGGLLTVEPGTGRGTRVRCQLPLSVRQAAA
jgi:signal transduction histidine kinase